MKVYLLDVLGRGPRYFTDEKSLISYLNRDDNSGELIHRYRLQVVEAQVETDTDGKSYLENYKRETRERNQREGKLNAVLGDEYAISVDKLMTYIKENAKEGILKQKFFEQLELIPIEKKQLSKFIAKKSGYLLYEVSHTVEYYKLLLSVHNFRAIEDRYYAIRYDQYGKEFNEGGFTKDVNKKNFTIAKSQLKN